ncbi:nitroreductase family protein [Ureibacillus chungkukjangi]|uniref:Putative NAD(P)H nitroreductase n=1 Tax=Ureibacillus chungkukjangi TaxID=1202712 RepID=A0A318TS60_9BACL|nr:nitroreductase [Ureibacillus chungkukjangi]MCM3389431.1 nitroreductase [Ureibacillus chungkukjangi]PYF02469.1 nitroreductase [Ureibacillus chungkukjangi]
MDIFEAIKTRRSIGLVSEEPVSKELIEKIIEAGTWAPSHYRTEPWKFFVLTGDSRIRLGKTLATIEARQMEDPTSESSQKKLSKIEEKPFRAPLIITVAVEPSDNPRALIQEEHGAVYAAIQNMLLAAHALGLAGYWRTGKPAYTPEMKKLFNLSENGEILGFLYFGHPKRPVPPGKRKQFDEATTWLTSESDFDNL